MTKIAPPEWVAPDPDRILKAHITDDTIYYSGVDGHSHMISIENAERVALNWRALLMLARGGRS